MGEKERGVREHQAYLFNLRSFFGRISSDQGQMFIALTRAYEWVPRTRDFTEDPRKGIQEIEVVEFRRLPTHSSKLQEVGILPTLVYFTLLGGLRGLRWLRKLELSSSSSSFLA